MEPGREIRLSFLSDRKGKVTGTQVWVLRLRGGEARQITNVPKKQGEIKAYRWPPDGQRLLLTVHTGGTVSANAFNDAAAKKVLPPIVITRYHFNQDIIGYLTAKSHTFLHLYDVATGKVQKLTSGDQYDERGGMWSPDGKEIAYISNHTAEPDRNITMQLFVVATSGEAQPQQLTHYEGANGGPPEWSPDGKEIGFLRGGPIQYWQQQENRLAVIAADGGHARVVAAKLDRPVSDPQWASDGRHILGLVTDDRNQYPANKDAVAGTVRRLVGSEDVSGSLTGKAGHEALVWTSDTKQSERTARASTAWSHSRISLGRRSPIRCSCGSTADRMDRTRMPFRRCGSCSRRAATRC